MTTFGCLRGRAVSPLYRPGSTRLGTLQTTTLVWQRIRPCRPPLCAKIEQVIQGLSLTSNHSIVVHLRSRTQTHSKAILATSWSLHKIHTRDKDHVDQACVIRKSITRKEGCFLLGVYLVSWFGFDFVSVTGKARKSWRGTVWTTS